MILSLKDSFHPYSNFVPPRPSSDRNFEIQNQKNQYSNKMKEWVEAQRKKTSKVKRPNRPRNYQKKNNLGAKKPWTKFFGSEKPRRKWSKYPNAYLISKHGTKPPRPAIPQDGMSKAYGNIYNTSPMPRPDLQPPPFRQSTSSDGALQGEFMETNFPGNNSYSSVYFETPSALDKSDNNVYDEVYEITMDDRNDVHDRSDTRVGILKDYYLGDNLSRTPSRRPNSYFYDEVLDNNLGAVTTPAPVREQPLPTYRTYVEPTTTKTTTTTTTTTTTPKPNPITTRATEYYPSTFTPKSESKSIRYSKKPIFSTFRPHAAVPGNSKKPTFTTFRSFFKQGQKSKTQKSPSPQPYRKSSTTSNQLRTTKSPIQDPIKQVTTSYESPLIPDQDTSSKNKNRYDPNMFQENINKERKPVTTPKYKSKVYQQIGPFISVNITNPSEKSWETVVTMKPELRRDEDAYNPSTPMSISTTQEPSKLFSTPSLREIDGTTTAAPTIFISTPAWQIDEVNNSEEKKWNDEKNPTYLNPSQYVSTPVWSIEEKVTTAQPATLISTPLWKQTTKQPTLFLSTPGWSIEEVITTKSPKVKPMMGFLSTPSSFNSGIQWGNTKDAKENKKYQKRNKYGQKRRPYNKRRKTTLTPKQSISAESFKTTGAPVYKTSPKAILNTIRSKRKQFTATPKIATKAPNNDIGKTLDKIISTSAFISTVKPRRYVAANSEIFAATVKPPPPEVTTPGWHIHSNADITTPTPQIKRADNFASNEVSSEYTVLSTVHPKRITKKTRNNIFQQIKKLAANKKSSRKSYKKPYSKTYSKAYTRAPKIHKFTADEAVGKGALKSGKFNFESQKVEKDTKMAQSTSHITVTKYSPEQIVNNIKKSPKQNPNWIPIQSDRRSDKANSPQSYKITPNLVKGGYKVSPVSPAKKSHWLLRSPEGTEFHFKSLQQIYDLNENNFVPG